MEKSAVHQKKTSKKGFSAPVKSTTDTCQESSKEAVEKKEQETPGNVKQKKTELKKTKNTSDSKCQQGKKDILDGPCASKKRKVMKFSEKKHKNEKSVSKGSEGKEQKLTTAEVNFGDELVKAEQMIEDENKSPRTELSLTEEGMNNKRSKESISTDEVTIEDELVMAEQMIEDENKSPRTELSLTEEGMNNKENKESFSKAVKVKKPLLPVRSLSDAEYEEIFRNAVNRVMNTPLDELMVSMARKQVYSMPGSNLCDQSEENKQPTETKKVKSPAIKHKMASVTQKKKQAVTEVKHPPIKKTSKSGGGGKKSERDGGSKLERGGGSKSVDTQIKDIQSSVCKVPSTPDETDDVADTGGCTEDNKENVPNQMKQKNTQEKKQRKRPKENKFIDKTKGKETKLKSSSNLKARLPESTKMTEPSQSTTSQATSAQDPKHVHSLVKKKTLKSNAEVEMNDRIKKRPKTNDTRIDRKSEVKVDRKKRMMEREVSQYGTWVQCCNRSCKKWRFLSEVHDPSELPESWFCSMNKDEDYNECDKAEQEYDEEEHIYTPYTEGTVVWAKMSGFPWWPAMIEMDPDSEYYFELENPASRFPSHYHVVFFDEKVSRAWLRTPCIQPFIGKENLNSLVSNKKSSYKTEIAAAKVKACKALQMDLPERLQVYSFCRRYTGKWGKDECNSMKHERKTLKVKTMKKSKDGYGRKKTLQEVSDESEVEVLNDTTVEDLLNNPNSLLSSLNDVLDSLGSLTDESDFVLSDEEMEDVNSDEDSNENNNVLLGEGRRKSRRQVRNKKSPEQQDSVTTTDGEEEAQHIECINTNTHQKPDPDSLHNQSSQDMDSEAISDPCSLHSQSDNETPTDYNACAGPHRQLKLDPDVFTMDMDSDEESESVKDHKIRASAESSMQKEQNQQENSKSPQWKNMNTDVEKKSTEKKKTKRDQHDDNVSCKNETSQSYGSPLSREDLSFLSQSDPQEQAVPSVETEFRDAEDQEQEFSLDFEMVPKPQPAMSVSMVNSMVGVNGADEDSDPFEMIEE